MTALDLLDRLRRADVRVWVEGGRLRANAPSGVLTDELRQQLADHREELQVLLERAVAAADHDPVTPVLRGPGQTFPLSFTQQRLWMLHALSPEAAAYHVVQAERIRGALNVQALEDAWSAVTRRHEMLRARVVVAEGEPALTIDDAATAAVRYLDLSERPGGAAEVDQLIQAEATRPFDLERGPLASMLILRVAADEHVVVIRLHHIISDQWSLGLLRGDLFALYRQEVQGIPADLPDLPVQYVDYATWQRHQGSSPAWEEARAYWRKTLAGVEPTELPSLEAPPPGSPDGGRICVSLPPSLLQGLTTLAGSAGGTLFMAFIAGFAATLARYTGQDDLTIGTPVAGRQRPEFERLVGPFINTLALRVVIPGDASFLDLVRHVRDVTLAAQAHQDLPFEQVVAIAAPPRRPGRPPLVQVMFNLLNTPPAGVALPGLEGESLTVDRQSSALDLTLIADMSDGTLTAEFRLDVIAEAGARQFVTHFLRLLTLAAADPTCPVSALSILDADERAWLTRMNDTGRPLADRLPGARLRELATATPDRTAVVCGAERLTCGDLARRGAALVSRLRAEGVGRDVLVGVCLRRSVHVAVALLAVLDAGGAYLPIDPALPGARRAWLIQDGRPQLILADDAGAAALGDTDVPILRIDQLVVADTPAAIPPVEHAAGPDDLAYALYTSGSTGQPKGVEITRGALSNFLDSMADAPGVGSEDVLVAVTTLSFDISTLEILLPLWVGAMLVIAMSEQVTDGHRLLALVRESHATVMQGTPATWQMLLEAGWNGSPAMKVLCGGEALTRDLADRLLERATSVWNLYGPTETTIWSTVDRVIAGDAITIGRPIANTSVYVLDASRDLVPVGVSGELYIGGAGVARGYRGRPDLTAGRFVPDSFAGRIGARMYRTGDLVRYRPDGRIDYLGRIDRQLKLRGFRIEPGEIEAVLEEHGEIRQAVVVLRHDAGDPMLVAYVTRRPDAAVAHVVDEGSLRASLRARLPAYMVPARVVFLEQLPLTPSGKIDHRALPPPGASAGGGPGEPMAPVTATEIRLAAIWQRVLKVDRVDLRDDFFAAGGHSLLAMRLVADVAESLDVDLSPGAIFEYPVFEELARHIDERRWTGSDRPWSIVQLAEGAASGVPFFWFHGIGGEVFSYVELSKHLGRSRPVYGVAADWSRAATNGPVTVQQIAAEYVREVTRIEPSGPYLLGGYCAGALLAVEVARLLRSRGAHVALVAVIDYRLDLGVRPGWAGLTLAFLRNLPRWFLQDALPSGGADLAGRVRSAIHRLRARISKPAVHQALDIRDRLGVWRFPTSQLALLQAHSEAFAAYEVPGVDTALALFVPETAPLFGPWPADDDRSWLERSHNRLHTYSVRGSHSTLLREPFATGLAARIERAVEDALADRPAG